MNKSAPTILQAAVRHHQQGQLQEAEQLCHQVCELAPEQPDALHLLAIIYAQSQRFSLANEYFEKAITSAPNRADFRSNFGNALWKQERSDEAIMVCQQALDIDPNRADTHNILGSIYLSQHRLDEATASFRNALAIHSRYPHALNNLGNVLQKQKQFEAAITHYQQAISLQENYPEAHNNLGRALKKIGRIDEARKAFATAVKLRPGFDQAIQNGIAVDSIWLKPLQGKTLLLRRYQEQDAAYLQTCYQNVAFMAQYNHYIPRHQHIDSLAKQLRQTHSQHPCQLKSVDWIITNTESDHQIGIANLVAIEFAHRRAEFLIGLPDPKNQRKGLGLEATLLVLDFAFNRVGLNKLTSFVYTDNVFSQKNISALGFTQESYLREQILDTDSGTFLDIYGYGMTARDLRESRRLSRLSQRVLGWDITELSQKS